MTHTYSISGMTCSGCQAKVQGLLAVVPGVQQVSVDLPNGEATISMDRHILTTQLQDALKAHPAYQLHPSTHVNHSPLTTPHIEPAPDETAASWLHTYKPILLVSAYILGVTLITAFAGGTFDAMVWMQHFMAGFFLVFSFFKMLDLRGFADSYSTYDMVARRFRGWGFIYPFVELGLGIAYLVKGSTLSVNLATLLIMVISIAGVLQSVLNKRKIRCACLGTVFNIPMSTVTIIEDALMIAMSALMLIHIW